MRLLCFLALVASAWAAPARGSKQHRSLNARNGPDPFVSVQEGRFYKAGQPYYLTSMNYWSAMNLAASAEAGGNLSRFETEVQQMAAAGVNNVRIMAASEGSQFGPQPFRMRPALLNSPYNGGDYNEEIFKGLDKAIATFAQYNMTVIMTLSNFWHWSGGAGQYVSWATNTSIPYPPSWSLALNPPFGDYTDGNWTEYADYASRFYANSSSFVNQTQTWFQQHIKTVAQRNNTVTGLTYNEDPAIMTWEIMNEPQITNLSQGWIASTADYIKSVAPKQLCTAGFESYQGKSWFDLVHSPSSIDYATAHIWVQNRGYYNMTDPSEQNYQNALTNATAVLVNASDWSVALGKPVVLEEFGMARDNWQNVAKGAPTQYYLYDASATTTNKDRYFQAVISSVVDYWKAGKGWAGSGPWAYGGIWRPIGSENQYNMTWAGDPPHEARGWYDVYSTDNSTLAIVKAQADNTTAFIRSGGFGSRRR